MIQIVKMSIVTIPPWGWITYVVWCVAYGLLFSIFSNSGAENYSISAYMMEIGFIVGGLICFPAYTLGVSLSRKQYMRRFTTSEKRIFFSNVILSVFAFWTANLVGGVFIMFSDMELGGAFWPLVVTWLSISSLAGISALFSIYGKRKLMAYYVAYGMGLLVLYLLFGVFTFLQTGSYLHIFIMERIQLDPVLTTLIAMIFGAAVIGVTTMIGFLHIQRKEATYVTTD